MTGTLKDQLPDSSRAIADIAVGLVFDNPVLFKEMVGLCLSEEMPYAPRAARVVSICSLECPELFVPLRNKFISALKHLKNEGVIRSLLKIYVEIPLKLSEKEKSILLNLCFDYLVSETMHVAIKVYSMDILFRLSAELPDIGFELYNILENNISFGSSGYKSKARKIMKALKNR